jgi:hypothetical protein
MDDIQLTGAPESCDLQQQGRKANNNGRRFEQQIAQLLRSHGYTECKDIPTLLAKPFFVAQYKGPFKSLYGLPMAVDFYAWHLDKFPRGLIIECKYQETGGSADEKFPYTIYSLKNIGIPAILLVIGAGAKRRAVDWCLRQQSPLLTVFPSLESFFYRANGGLL